jgi:SAM-dependent MidA family methyltransferase
MHVQVPKDMPCIVMAHEFLDALPVHVFKHDEERGWLEVLIDEEPNAADPKVRLDAHA